MSSIRVFGDVTVLIKHTILIYIPSKNVNFPFIFIKFLYSYNFITLLRLDWDRDYIVLSNHTHYGHKIIKCKVMRSPYIIKNYELEPHMEREPANVTCYVFVIEGQSQ